MQLSRIPYVSLIAAATLLASCRSPQAAPPPVPNGGDDEGIRVTTNATAIAEARADSLSRPYVAADVAFMTGMVGHHAQAIEMAQLAPARGASPAVQRLAARIINAQQDEITLMQQWLADRQKPIPPATSMTHAGGHAHHAMMPGMLSAEQMRQLAAARGTEFDRLFLTFMIQHHQGAVVMVKELFSTPGAGQDHTVFKFASDVNVDQTTEINRMQQMLASLPSTQPNQP